jgi:hypothetical protein
MTGNARSQLFEGSDTAVWVHTLDKEKEEKGYEEHPEVLAVSKSTV